jgi:hypothetical protein
MNKAGIPKRETAFVSQNEAPEQKAIFSSRVMFESIW